ncbi:hypothetical protein [Marinifilum caeruleilacunae]|uniref:VWA domain-containing protein n=1 Tax=Marinifilum caeruleilacunae TaxID=2499076 RepID=A0ABX1X1D1_9BACT|nr:hypothetical protein [Marinifilum caeruleilacunae]NOU61894.1 hypothetical protein [Marinifilum caeruleilacunae]
MDISLVTQYSVWWILPIVLLTSAIVYRLYFYKKNTLQELPAWKLAVLASLRFLAIFTLLFLLLGPRIKYQKRIENKPVLLLAQDNSSSLRYGKDSTYYLNDYPEELNEFAQNLEKDYAVRKISFGNQLGNLDQLNFSESASDFSSLFKFVKDNYGNQDNVELLLASDGLYNSGANPRYLGSELNFPIHSIQLGDTTEISDVSIYTVRSNRIGFTNTKLPVRIGVKALQSENRKLKLSIRNQNKLILQDEILVNSKNFYLEKDYLLEAEKKGLQKFTVQIETDASEYSLKNNTGEFVIDILDSKRKIVIAFDQYHPDLAAMQSAILENSNFDCQLVNLSKTSLDLEAVNLLIAYQIPSRENAFPDLFTKLEYAKVPTLLLVGGNSDLQRLNTFKLGLNFDNRNAYFQDVSYMENENFSLFKLKSEGKKVFEKLPPLLAPFGDINFNAEYHVLAYQRIKNIDTQYPLIAFTSIEDRKLGWIFGEGVWRWKLNEFRQFDNNSNFNDLLNRAVQYLALKVKKDQLIIHHSKDFIEGNPIRFQAELYDKSYQLSNNAELNFVLTDKENNSYEYQFSRNEKDYDLVINYLSKGRYQYRVSTGGLDDNLERTGEFIVRSDNIEAKNLQADPTVLKYLSETSGGTYFRSLNFKKIKDHFLIQNNRKPTISYETNYGNAVDLIYLLSFIIILMILEWFLRKYWLGN